MRQAYEADTTFQTLADRHGDGERTI